MQDLGLSLDNTALMIVVIVGVVYFVAILAFGLLFNRFSHDTNDFFYSGQRFPFWLITGSMIATGIGSYSFLKYAQAGYEFGMSSTMTYLNDWFVMPFFIFGWLPIIFYSKVRSIPEYFERRFNKTARYLAVAVILSYMLFYIGYNLFTIGVAVEGITGISLWMSIPVIGLVLGTYVTLGGQTAVIFTDLVQGFMLYFTGALLLIVGVGYLGGFGEFWGALPVTHRVPVLTSEKFDAIAIFWGEGIAGSIAFTFMNQGFIMRYLSAKSVREGKKAAFLNVVILMPVSAIVVGCVGWIARALVENGQMAAPGDTSHVFVHTAWKILSGNNWLFGFVMAALTAALMSTVDTLINACAAIGINDIYRPLVKKDASEEHYLKAAKLTSAAVSVLGILLAFLFISAGKNLFNLHYKGILVIIPALVTTIFMGAFWKRFNATAAVAAIAVGMVITYSSLWRNHGIAVAAGLMLALFVALAATRRERRRGFGALSVLMAAILLVALVDPSRNLIQRISDFLGGPARADDYFRSVLGMGMTALVGFVVTWFTPEDDPVKTRGLTIDSLDEAMRMFKGSEPNFEKGVVVRRLHLDVVEDAELEPGLVWLPAPVMEALRARDGDLIYIADDRRILAGLRSVKLTARLAPRQDATRITLRPCDLGDLLPHKPVYVEKLL